MKKSGILCGSVGLLLLITSLLGLYDMEISRELRQWDQLFGRFFEIFGMLPFFISIVILGYTFLADTKGSLLHIPARVYVPLAGLVIFGSTVAGAGSSVAYLFPETAGILLLPVILILGGVVTMLSWKYRGRFLRAVERKQVLLGVLFLITILLFNQVGKFLWGRVRPRDLLDAAEFSRWYLPQGVTGNASFPSAHATFATAGLALVYGIQNKRLRIAVWGFSLFWGASTAVSRIIVGAHFPTDVAMGFGSTLIIYFWIFWYGDRFIDRYVLPQEKQ